ncbi:MAG: molybdenum cofactor guanylyltransferase [Vicinamibacterales bacterium]
MRSAAILAGGRAVRLGGRAKHALAVGGRAILDRQRDLLASLAVDDVMIVGRFPGAPIAGVRLVPDAVEHGGALGGLYSALMAATADRVLVLACDLPFLTREFLAHLMGTAPDADAVVPRTVDGWHPLCGVYHRRAAAGFRARLDAGALRITDALAGCRVHEIGPAEVARFDPDGVLLTNVNTPDDFARAVAHAATHAPTR